jgi:hypothetical protein
MSKTNPETTPLLCSLLKENMVKWYLLPLTVEFRSIGERKITGAYLDKVQPIVWVCCRGEEKCIPFRIHEDFLEDLLKFRCGNYSRMGDKAKELIIERSGLLYNEQDGTGQALSDAKLLALYRHPSLRTQIQEELGVVLERWSELIGSPKESWFFPEGAQTDGINQGDPDNGSDPAA